MVTTFDKTQVLRLEVEATPTGLANEALNPSGDLGAWWWTTPGINGQPTISKVINTGRSWLKFQNYSNGNGPDIVFTSEQFRLTAGQWVALRYRMASQFYVRMRFEFFDSTGALIGTSGGTGNVTGGDLATNGAVQTYGAVQAPANTVRARLRVQPVRDSLGTALPNDPNKPLYVREVTIAKAATSAALDGLGYIEPVTWTNVLGPTHSIKIARNELNVGLLTAEILDASLDPSQSTLVRPGKRCRLMALDATTGTYKPLFTGKISSGQTVYDATRTDAKKARVTITALDAASTLAQTPRPMGGGAFVRGQTVPLEGAGVPWNLNGETDLQGTLAQNRNDNASALDQLAIARDSVLAYAWVSAAGVFNMWDRATISTTNAGVLDETVYSDFRLDYDTDRCINAVTVKLRRENIANGQMVEVPYGPYVNQGSIDQWGPHSSEFTVYLNNPTDASIQAYAASILAANATPAVRLNSVTVPIRNASDVTPAKALLDLYDAVQVKNTNSGINQQMRILGIETSITPEKWLTTYDFAASGAVATPQQTPSLPDAAAGSTPQFGSVYVETRGDGWGTAAPPNGTSGTAFTVPTSGVWQGRADGSAYLSTVGSGAVEIYIDGVYRGQLYLYFNQANTHAVMIPAMFTFNITAGTHYLWVRKAFTSSDGNDFIKVTGPILPA